MSEQLMTQDEFFGTSTTPVPQTGMDQADKDQTLMTQAEFFGQTEPDEEDGSFLENVRQRIQERQGQVTESFVAGGAGEQTPIETGLQVLGKGVAGTALDVLGEGASSALETAGEVASAVTPDFIEDPIVEAAQQAGSDILNSDLGKQALEAMAQGVEVYEDWAEANPRAARNVESTANIMLVGAPVKAKPAAKPVVPKQSLLSKTATNIDNKAKQQIVDKKDAYVEELVQPKMTPTARAEASSRTEVTGPLKTKRVVPTPDEQDTVEIIRGMPDVKPENTIQENLLAIQDEIATEAISLQKKLGAKPIPVDKAALRTRMEDAKTRLKTESPVIVGDAEKSAERLLTKWDQLLEDAPPTATGVLEARKKFDRWVSSQKPNVFDPKTESALSLSLREIRTTANDFLAENATDVAVKESLKKQSLLYNAVDNIKVKAGEEAGNVFSRAWQNVARVVTIRNQANSALAAAAGMGGLGAAAYFAPFLTKAAIAGGVAYSAGKIIMSPAAKKATAALIRETDRAIKVATDPQMMKQLRADRAALVELSENAVIATQSSVDAQNEQEQEQPQAAPPAASTADIAGQIVGRP